MKKQSFMVGLIVLGAVLCAKTSAATNTTDIKFNSPSLTITHQNLTPGACYTSLANSSPVEPCDAFMFTSKFRCQDCGIDLSAAFASNQGTLLFAISNNSGCPQPFDPSYVYRDEQVLPSFAVSHVGRTTHYSFPGMFVNYADSKVYFVDNEISIAGPNGTLTVTGSADFSSFQQGAAISVFFGYDLDSNSKDSDDSGSFFFDEDPVGAGDSDEPNDQTCITITPKFQTLNVIP